MLLTGIWNWSTWVSLHLLCFLFRLWLWVCVCLNFLHFSLLPFFRVAEAPLIRLVQLFMSVFSSGSPDFMTVLPDALSLCTSCLFLPLFCFLGLSTLHLYHVICNALCINQKIWDIVIHCHDEHYATFVDNCLIELWVPAVSQVTWLSITCICRCLFVHFIVWWRAVRLETSRPLWYKEP